MSSVIEHVLELDVAMRECTRGRETGVRRSGGAAFGRDFLEWIRAGAPPPPSFTSNALWGHACPGRPLRQAPAWPNRTRFARGPCGPPPLSGIESGQCSGREPPVWSLSAIEFDIHLGLLRQAPRDNARDLAP